MKKIITHVLALVMVLSLTACGNKGSATTSDNNTSSGSSTTPDTSQQGQVNHDAGTNALVSKVGDKFARKPNQNRIDSSMKVVIIKLYH